MHLEDVEGALKEARRVLKSGGRIVLAGPDLETMVVTSSEANQELAKTALRARIALAQNGRAGSYLRGQLIKMGFTDVQVTSRAHIFTELSRPNPLMLDLTLSAARTQQVLTPEQIDLLRQDFIEHESRDAFQFSITTFIISGTRP